MFLKYAHRAVPALVAALTAGAMAIGSASVGGANPTQVGEAARACDPIQPCLGKLTLEPRRYDFGQVTATLMSSQDIVATNSSKSTSIEFGGVVAKPPFSIEGSSCTGTLAAGQSCLVVVAFHPMTIGKVKDEKALTFTDSAKNSPQHVKLDGEGVPGPTPTATVTATPSTTPTGATPTNTPTCTSEPTPHISGLVLVAGGQGSDGTALNTAEVFNPSTNTFTLTTALGGSNLTDGRYSHAAAAVSFTQNYDEVVLTGGIDASGVTSSTDTFDSGTNEFTAGTMSASRVGQTSTFLVLPIGDLVIAGGQNASGTVLSSADVYNYIGIEGGSPSMNASRVNAAAAPQQFYYQDSCVRSETALITGGSDGTNTLQSAELFDSLTGIFTLTTDPSIGGTQMNAPRVYHTATLFASGETLIAGGEGATGVAQSTAEIFNGASFTLTTALGGTNMTVARAMHTATAIGGQVLIAGGIDNSGNVLSSAEVFDGSTNTFTAVGSMHSARYNHAAALLSNGDVLITGGEDGSGNPLNTAEIYNPGTQTFTLTTALGGSAMNAARKLHTATAY